MDTAAPDRTLQASQLIPPRPPRRARPMIVLAVLGALAVAGLGLLLLGGNDSSVRSENLRAAAPTTTAKPATSGETATTAVPATSPAPAGGRSQSAPATSSPSTTAAPAPRLSDDTRLSLDGLGPVDVGMTVEQASAAAGTSIRFLPEGREVNPECDYARGVNGPEGVAFMVVNGTIRRVDVGTYLPGMHPSEVRTVSGIGLGSTEAEVQRTYGGRIRVEPHPYTPGGHYLVYTPGDASLSHLGMIFETDGERVTSFRAGFVDEVSWIEGCS